MSFLGSTDAQPTRQERKQRTADLLDRARTAPPAERAALLDEVICLNIPVAQALAARYRNRGQSPDDLEQVACLALTKAVHGFDPDRGEDLLVYAVPSVLGELKRHFRDASWMVRPPRRLQELRQSLVETKESLGQRLGRAPNEAELAEAAGVERSEVVDALTAGAGSRAEALDRFTGTDVPALLDQVPAEEPGFAQAEARAVLGPIMRRLGRRDRRILRLRFFESRTQQQIADELGVSQVQVSRLLRRILDELRRGLTERPRIRARTQP